MIDSYWLLIHTTLRLPRPYILFRVFFTTIEPVHTILTPNALICCQVRSAFNVHLDIIFKWFRCSASTKMTGCATAFGHLLSHTLNYIHLAISIKSITISFASLLRLGPLHFITVRRITWFLTLMITTRLLTIICIISGFHGHNWVFAYWLVLIICFPLVSLFDNDFGRAINTRAIIRIAFGSCWT